jgi:hypothetical protein
MGHHGLHKNRQTGEVLAQDVQICTMCFRNFASDDAWEKHWERKNPRGNQCLDPTEVGLISFRNSRGATIYRLKK